MHSPGEVLIATATMSERTEYVGRVFAVKKTPVTNHVRHPILLHEACALVLLRGVSESNRLRLPVDLRREPPGHSSIPNVIAWGRSQYFEYLVMDRLGSSLDKILKTIGPHGLSLRNAIVLICQMVSCP